MAPLWRGVDYGGTCLGAGAYQQVGARRFRLSHREDGGNRKVWAHRDIAEGIRRKDDSARRTKRPLDSRQVDSAR